MYLYWLHSVELTTECASVQRVFTHPVPRDVHVNCRHCIPACCQCCYVTTKLNVLVYPAFKNVFGQLVKDASNEKKAIRNNYRGKRTHCNKYYSFVNMVKVLKDL